MSGILTCGSISTAFADEISFYEDISYGDQVINYQPKAMEAVQINVNHLGWQYVYPDTLSKIHLEPGDKYEIRMKAVDGEWYHTQELTYNFANLKHLTIKGDVTPLSLVGSNDENIASFYDSYNLRGYPIKCKFLAAYSECDIGENSANPKYVFKGGGVGTIGGGSGTAYINSNVFNGIGEYAANMTGYSVLFMTRLSFALKDNRKIGYAKLSGFGAGVHLIIGTFSYRY